MKDDVVEGSSLGADTTDPVGQSGDIRVGDLAVREFDDVGLKGVCKSVGDLTDHVRAGSVRTLGQCRGSAQRHFQRECYGSATAIIQRDRHLALAERDAVARIENPSLRAVGRCPCPHTAAPHEAARVLSILQNRCFFIVS